MSVGLQTRYLGLDLGSPIVVSACPLSRDVATVRRMEKAGAGAVVLFSLFEEQFGPATAAQGGGEECSFRISPAEYLDHIRRLKDAVAIPVIASLNAAAPGAWLDSVHAMAAAGADAVEINIYRVVVEPSSASGKIEDDCVEILERVRRAVSIPVAVKLTPFFTNVAGLAARLSERGVDGLVLFNRLYQPTIDVERRQLILSLELSTPAEARLPLLWIAHLSGRIRASLAASSGIHGVKDVLRALMAGADVAMVCSVLLRHGVDRLADLHRLLAEWLETHHHGSVREIRGVMSEVAREDPDGLGRSGYAKILGRYA
jgi:dihydroorotate dehydrogenase (fumarate)